MKYITVDEIKDRWNVSRDVVYDYINSGQLQAVKFGRCWRIKPGDLEKFEKEKMRRDQAELKSRRLISM